MPGFIADFSLSVTRALRDQLLEALESLEAVPLNEANLELVEKRGGVYALFEDDVLLYVGKSTRDLVGRLGQHRRKLSGRTGSVLQRVSFKTVYVAEDLDAMAPEKMLIGRLRSDGQAAWNTNGFGNKDPGKRRDSSLVEDKHFDRQYPIDLEIEIDLQIPPASDLLSIMKLLKKQLPYTFRFQSDKPTQQLLRKIIPDDLAPEQSIREVGGWIQWIAEQLPSTWSIVALPGYLIAYDHFDPASCDSRTGAWTRRSDDTVAFVNHEPRFSDEEVEVEPNEDDDSDDGLEN